MKVVATYAVKGGTGKSTVAMNLALEIAALGHKTGFLDGDIDSPFASDVLRLEKGSVTLDRMRRMVPARSHGLRVMSFSAWLVDEAKAVTMRGDMQRQWLADALKHTDWGDTEVLVVDLPAGSGESFLAVREIAGAELVGVVAVAQPTTAKALGRVFHSAAHHRVRILGAIENMSGPVFGEGYVKAFCEENEIQYLGSVPLDARIREAHERGDPKLPEDVSKPVKLAAALVEGARHG